MRTEPAWHTFERVAEAYRVLAPGGHFAVTTGTSPRHTVPNAIQDAMDALFAEFSEYLPPDRQEEMRLRMRALPGPGAVLQQATALLIGRKP